MLDLPRSKTKKTNGEVKMIVDRVTPLLVQGILGWLLLCVMVGAAAEPSLDPRLTNYSIEGQIRFRNGEQAEERREKLIRAIWSEGLPKTRPTVTENVPIPEELSVIQRNLTLRADLYTVNVSAMDFLSLTYVLHPSAPAPANPRLAIVHAGHMPEDKARYLEAGLKTTIERLLEYGFTVAVMQMPMVAWNKDGSGTLPNGNSFRIDLRGTSGHDELFKQVEPTLGARTMAFFLEPVVQVTSELLARYPLCRGVLMIGLSGGGWTTHFSAAIDPRILYSVPVAGALPLYARPHSKGSTGDAEQNYGPILGEEDTDSDGILDRATGVCSWLEIFALGGISPDGKSQRKQVQVINYHDSCCFDGPVSQTYSELLSKRVAAIGQGEWQISVDHSHHEHVISGKTLDDVLMPMVIQMTQTP
jgi:hypothetical protein